MKNISVALFFFFATTFAFAQKSNIDVISLKNGNVISGKIIEQVPNLLLKIKTEDGNIITISMDNVEKITTAGEVIEQKSPQQKSPLIIAVQPIENIEKQKENISSKRSNSEFVGNRRMYLAFGLNIVTVFDYSAYSGGKLEFGYYINPKNLLSIEIGGGSDETGDNNTNLYLVSWSYIVNLSVKFQWRIGPSLGVLNMNEIESAFAFGGSTGVIWNFSKNERWFLDLGCRLFGTSLDAGSQFTLSAGWRF